MHHLSAASATRAPAPLVSEQDLWLWLLLAVAVVAVASAACLVPPLLRHRPTGGSVSTPIKASTWEGDVTIRVDAAGARDIADAVEFAYASGFLVDSTRPTYLAEVAMIRRAAAYADDLAGNPPAETIRVPLLRVVGGELA